jgi:hypothetical protein
MNEAADPQNDHQIFQTVIGHYPSSCFYLDTTFRRQDSVSVVRWNLLSWTQSIELVPISGHQYEHKIGYRIGQHKPSARVKTNIKIIKQLHIHEA